MATMILIEDDLKTAKLAAKLLQQDGHQVILAQSGEEGLDYIEANQPAVDLILVDLGLPDLDGETVIAMIRAQPEMASVPIIAFTAFPPDTAHKMAEAYGCNGVIVKPIDIHTFSAEVGALLPTTS